MTEKHESPAERKSRLRWITLGEAIAIAALVVSAVGVWTSWKNSAGDERPSAVVENGGVGVPLILRGRPIDEGQTLEISPVDSGHALQSLNVIVAASTAIDLGSDGQLSAEELESALGDKAAGGKGTHRLRVRIDAKYVEAGADKTATGSYVIRYRWESGGLFGGRSLRLVGLSR